MTPHNIYIVFMANYDAREIFYTLAPGQPRSFDHILREEIEKAGFNLEFSSDASDLEDAAAIISWEINDAILNNIIKHPTKNCVLLTFEPPMITPHYYHPAIKQYFGTIYTSTDDLVDNETYFKLHTPSRSHLKVPDSLPEFSQRKLCVIVAGNKTINRREEFYSQRRKVATFFTKTGELDLYGFGWQGMSSWKGEAGNNDKWNVLQNYRFNICYENSGPDGYITERLVDAFTCGCIPIYLGPDNTSNYIPKDCYLDIRDFSSYQSLYSFMKNMDQTTYDSYKAAARKFLESPKIQCFSAEYIAKRIVEKIVRNLSNY
ncbi:MAG: putative fucosyl transferase [Parachlamydiales bacterium]|nr:putative fucosyl transferase [Parachlamydiales bacterium]